MSDRKMIYLDDAINALDSINGVEEVLKSLPSAKPEIIQCKDCNHQMPYDWCSDDDIIGCACFDMPMSVNDFCSRAERKTK